MKFVFLSADWWDEQTPDFKEQYVKQHPKSKYAKLERAKREAEPKSKQGTVPANKKRGKKKKKSTRAVAAPTKTAITAKPQPSASPDAPKEEPVKRLTLNDEDLKIAEDAIKAELEKANLPEVTEKIRKAKKTEKNVEEAQLAAAAVCMLAALALTVVFPEAEDAVIMLATQAGAAWWDVLDDKDKDKDEDDEKEDEESPEFEHRVDELSNEEERTHFNRQVGLDANGNFSDEADIDSVVDQFVDRKKKTRSVS